MADQQRPKVKGDIKRNRLYITLSSDTRKNVLEKVYTEVRFCVADLKPGFDVVTDLSLCTIGHLNGISTLRKIWTILSQIRLVRLSESSGKKVCFSNRSLGLRLYSKVIHHAYVTTIEEAEDKLKIPPGAMVFVFYMFSNGSNLELIKKKGKGKSRIFPLVGARCRQQQFI